ncbi:MAG: hypothetical protein SFU56_05235 [Capsulimonadales bacterium]|nr:hypothetical protein [Capsulimonadales bacterium]
MTSAMLADKVTPAPGKPQGFSIDQRFIAPILITFILLMGEMQYKFLEHWEYTAMAILASILTEIVCGKLVTGKIPHLASAYVTGISAGILIRSPEWWPYVIAGMLATSSKYVIRVNGRHLWNPSNLAIVILLLVAPETVATLSIQWGNYLLPMVIVWILGSVIIYNLKRFHICATYVFFFFVFAFLRSLVSGNGFSLNAFYSEIAPITGPMYQLYVFFMITDPKTTLHTKKGQMLVAFLIAATESALRMWAPVHIAIHAPYFALTLMGPSSNLIEIYYQWKAKKAAAKGDLPPSAVPPAPAAA